MAGTEAVSDATRVFILGPTASGKTAVAIELAEFWGCPVISADSRQCYKYLDIGTDKPYAETLQRVKHYNISNLEPDQPDSSRAFARRVADWERGIIESGKPVLVSGGSTMHLRELIFGMDSLPPKNDDNLKILKQEHEQSGLETLFLRLRKIDPEYASAMHGLNRHRIYRALDVWMQTGKPFSSFHTGDKPKPGHDRYVFGLDWPRARLHQRIEERVAGMISKGFVDEVRDLLARGCDPALQSLQTVGYREVIRYLSGDCSHEQMVADIMTGTRRYARRQLTWFRKWGFIRWINMENHTPNEVAHIIADTIRRVAAEEKSR
jgi:tRNA dimethylallyltransferase